MIHIQFKMTKQDYRTAYIQAMTLYYMKIYLITLAVCILLINVLANLTKNTILYRSTATMVFTFIPVMLLCLLMAITISLIDVRRAAKKYPELMEGNFKIKFEKNFMMMQINGNNKKLHYHPYRFHYGFSNSFMLYQPQGGSIVIPKNLVTKEQRKQIKAYVKQK